MLCCVVCTLVNMMPVYFVTAFAIWWQGLSAWVLMEHSYLQHFYEMTEPLTLQVYGDRLSKECTHVFHLVTQAMFLSKTVSMQFIFIVLNLTLCIKKRDKLGLCCVKLSLSLASLLMSSWYPSIPTFGPRGVCELHLGVLAEPSVRY